MARRMTVPASSSLPSCAITVATASRTDTRPSLLLTRKLPSSVMARLDEACDVERFEGEGAMPHDELVARIAGKQALVSTVTEAVDRAVIDAATSLRVIANVGVGYNNIDVAAA